LHWRLEQLVPETLVLETLVLVWRVLLEQGSLQLRKLLAPVQLVRSWRW
jgi:hypothetical protein